MYKDVPEQLFCRRPLLGLHEDPFEELPAVVRHVGGQDGVSGLRGNLKDGRHGLELCPRRSLSQHLHDGAADTPDVCLPAVTLSADHLWAHPVRGTGHRLHACS